MVHYKLTYFNLRGFAEVTRQLFHLADVEFEDVRFDHGDGTWEKLKPTTPFGQVPVLSVDGFDIPQSAAIARYVARKYGFAGKTPEEEAWVDAIADLFKDFIFPIRPLYWAVRDGKSEEELEKIRKEVGYKAAAEYFVNLRKILEKNESGFLVGASLTWADLLVADNLTTLKNLGLFDPKTEPKLAAFQAKIESTPKLKEYLAKRPETKI